MLLLFMSICISILTESIIFYTIDSQFIYLNAIVESYFHLSNKWQSVVYGFINVWNCLSFMLLIY